MARALEGSGDHALVGSAAAGAVAGQNFGVRGHEPAQKLRVFVVHVRDFLLAEDAGFFYSLR